MPHITHTIEAKLAVTRWLLEHDSTRWKLAARIGMSAPSFSKLLNGDIPVEKKFAARLLRVTGVDLLAYTEQQVA